MSLKLTRWLKMSLKHSLPVKMLTLQASSTIWSKRRTLFFNTKLSRPSRSQPSSLPPFSQPMWPLRARQRVRTSRAPATLNRRTRIAWLHMWTTALTTRDAWAGNPSLQISHQRSPMHLRLHSRSWLWLMILSKSRCLLSDSSQRLTSEEGREVPRKRERGNQL